MIYKDILYNILYWSGFNYFFSIFLRKKIFILMYHSISDFENISLKEKELFGHISIDKRIFEKQINYLKKRGHTFISFSDLTEFGLRNKKKPTIIYFDDGFKDNLKNAIPILNKYSIPATFFIVSGILDRKDMLWTAFYREVLIKKGLEKKEQDFLIEEIKNKSEKERKSLMKSFEIKNYNYLFDFFMTWEDIRFLSNVGFEIGSHGVSHQRLTECSEEELLYESNFSKERIEKELNKEIDLFSFPYGRSDEKVIQRLGTAGYKIIVSKGLGINDFDEVKKSPIFFKNISPKPFDSMKSFKLKLYSLNLFK